MRHTLTTTLVTTFLLATNVANATLKGGQCVLINSKGDYQCTVLGVVKLTDIYDRGWRVVTSYVQPVSNIPVLIIEEQKPWSIPSENNFPNGDLGALCDLLFVYRAIMTLNSLQLLLHYSFMHHRFWTACIFNYPSTSAIKNPPIGGFYF